MMPKFKVIPRLRPIILIAALWVATSCVAAEPAARMRSTTTAHPTPELPAAAYGTAADAFAPLIAAERQASIAGDLDLLAMLWAPDGRVVDHRNTDSPADDYIWSGRPAILDRYVVAVFPNPPPPLETLANAAVEIEGERALVANGGDRWRLIRRDGRWWLLELRYQLGR